MRRSMLLLAVLTGYLFTPVSPAAAQSEQNVTTSEVSIDVSARVLAGSVELITIRSINLSGAEAENGRIDINPIFSSNAGKMIAVGSPGSDIRVSFLENRELTHSSGNEILMFNYVIAGNTEDDQSTAEILQQENRELGFNSEGLFYLWIGGNVDISQAVPGNYQGEFTLEVEYI